jgi:putative acetyltransferase
MAEKIALRPALPADAPALAALFRASVEEFGAEDYSQRQVEAWSAQAEDEAAFAEKLAGKITILGLIGGEIAGFATLKGADMLDMLYVHPHFARQRVATQLCDALEKLSQARKATVLTADVSDCAQVFFVKRAYEPQRRNMVFLGDEVLGNTTMTKQLPALTGKMQ